MEHGEAIQEEVRLSEAEGALMKITDKIRDSMAYLLNLEEGWDSYGAKKISLVAIAEAGRLLEQLDLPEPQIVPCSDGGVQLEWHQNGLDIELCISAVEEKK